MFGGKNISFGNLKERVQSAQQEFSASWKTIADKAKKEAKIVNKKARKALATEDGGKLRENYILTVNLDAGHTLFKTFEETWASMHKESVTNVKKAEEVDRNITNFSKEWVKWNGYLEEFHGNLVVLPEVVAKVEIIQNRIEAIGKQTQKIEELLLQYEDACERFEFEKQKMELKVKLSQLVETKHAEYTLKRAMIAGKDKQCERTVVEEESTAKLSSVATPKIHREVEREKSVDKQQAYEDAFLDQMNQYIKYGELEKPIAGSVGEIDNVSQIEDITIDDSDLSTLKEFLGPEELNSVLQAQASQNKAIKNSTSSNNIENSVITAPTLTEDQQEAIDAESTETDKSSSTDEAISSEVKSKSNTKSGEAVNNQVDEHSTSQTNDKNEMGETDIERKPSRGSEDDDDGEFFDAAD